MTVYFSITITEKSKNPQYEVRNITAKQLLQFFYSENTADFPYNYWLRNPNIKKFNHMLL